MNLPGSSSQAGLRVGPVNRGSNPLPGALRRLITKIVMLSLGAHRCTGPVANRKRKEPSLLRQVAEGVQIRESEFCQSNAVVVHGRAGVLLIDPGCSATKW